MKETVKLYDIQVLWRKLGENSYQSSACPRDYLIKFGSGFKLSRMLEVKVLGADATFGLPKLFMLLFYASYSTYFSFFTPVDLGISTRTPR